MASREGSPVLFLIDGYNVTKRDPATAELSLEAQRDALVRRLRVRGADLLGIGRCVVVFDARDGGAGATVSGTLPEVVFARTRTADDEIVRIAASSGQKVVIVSDDRELLARARVHATHELEQRSASSVFEAASGRRGGAKKRRGSVARDAGLPAGANRITQELKDLWLTDEDE